ncbi:MAG: SDR family oxidoreductase [Candidatus Saccharimonadales bacterium]
MKSKTYTLVTGASSGIGKELAIIAASKGHNVVLVSRGKEELTKLARDLTKRFDIFAEVIETDLTDSGSITSIMSTLGRKKITVDTLINNAGFGDYGPFEKADIAKQLGMVDLNIRALTELTHYLMPGMINRGSGKVMNVASIASFFPGPMMSVYFASKAFVLSFSEALAEEVKGTGVTVTCLCPGSTKTAFGDTAHTKKSHSTQTSKVTAAEVASFGWQAMINGKRVAVHGFTNKYIVFVVRLLPRSLVAKAVLHMNK